MHLFDKHKEKLSVDEEDLAVPEVYTGEVDESYQEKPDLGDPEADDEEIRYDNVAIPEIHIRRLEHKE